MKSPRVVQQAGRLRAPISPREPSGPRQEPAEKARGPKPRRSSRHVPGTAQLRSRPPASRGHHPCLLAGPSGSPNGAEPGALLSRWIIIFMTSHGRNIDMTFEQMRAGPESLGQGGRPEQQLCPEVYEELFRLSPNSGPSFPTSGAARCQGVGHPEHRHHQPLPAGCTGFHHSRSRQASPAIQRSMRCSNRR